MATESNKPIVRFPKSGYRIHKANCKTHLEQMTKIVIATDKEKPDVSIGFDAIGRYISERKQYAREMLCGTNRSTYFLVKDGVLEGYLTYYNEKAIADNLPNILMIDDITIINPKQRKFAFAHLIVFAFTYLNDTNICISRSIVAPGLMKRATFIDYNNKAIVFFDENDKIKNKLKKRFQYIINEDN